MQGKSSKPRAGFTLIELLVVIAIIAILAAILFPVFAQARGKARQITGTSNIKQASLSILMYSQDYDEKFPRTGFGGICHGQTGDDGSIPPGECNQYGTWDWQNTTAPYVKNTGLYTSPGDASQETIGWWTDFVNPDGEFSLLMNDLLAHPAPTGTDGYANEKAQQVWSDGTSQAAVNAPTDCILLAEGHGGWNKGAGLPDPYPDAAGVIENPIPPDSQANMEDKWHKEQSISGNCTFMMTGVAYDKTIPPIFSGLPVYFGGNNFAFVDGHAKWVRTANSDGRPTMCSTLPWVKTMDPQQRGVEDTGSYCGNNNPLPGGWGGHQWF
ncbi:MAG TPA: prepilin-type N-terminal cleavage/methylation domain-containing protein [Chthonomonadaceae bacterium]|nr:prepilin-type N-terminal cleavage/methylation domain-containing protein [Chthonomonadaceae bacterium]